MFRPYTGLLLALFLFVPLSGLVLLPSPLSRLLFVMTAILVTSAPSWWQYVIWRRQLRELRHMAAHLRNREFDARVSVEGDPLVAELQQEINHLARSSQNELFELRTTQTLMAEVLNGMQEGVLVTDAQAMTVLANPALLLMLDLTDGIENRSVVEIHRSPELLQAFQRALESDAPVTTHFQTRGVAPHFLEVRVTRWGARNHGGCFAVFHDVTETRRLGAVRREFVANASHELRTPVAAIRGFAETLLDSQALDPESLVCARAIERNATRLTSLVDDILALARIEAPGYRPKLEPVALLESIRTVVASLQPLITARRVRVTVTVDPTHAVLAEKSGMERILVNLIDNALKYTLPEGRIDVSSSLDGNLIRFIVEDSGIGIPKPDLPRIFERFFRVDSARSRVTGGTGLGLSIVRHLVSIYGGEITAESQYGVGSRFYVTLRSAILEES